MSAVRPYFRNILDALGFHEWESSFDVDNIPNTIQDKVYHLTIGSISIASANQMTRAFDFPITVKMFLKDYDTNTDAIDDGIEKADLVMSEALKVSNRLTQTGIKDVTVTTINIIPMSAADNESVIIEINFIAKIFCALT